MISSVLSENYFNQNQRKLRYILSQTYICNLSAHSDHGLPQNVISMFTFAPCCDQYTLRKKCPGLLHQLKFRSAALICRESLDNLVFFFKYVSDSYAFLTRKCSTMQHGNSSVFSQKGFPPCCQMTLPLRARATVRSTRFLHADAMENVTYTRTVPNCIPSSGVHLSCPIRLFGLFLD